MEKEQAKLLTYLAKKLGKEKRSKEVAFRSLKLAGLLTASGNISENYPNLNRFISSSSKINT